MELFLLEWYCDRQMMDYLTHDLVENAMRVRLSGWFELAEIGLEKFARKGWNIEKLLSEAEKVECPFKIDVARKTRLVLTKLKGDDLQLI